MQIAFELFQIFKLILIKSELSCMEFKTRPEQDFERNIVNQD